MRLSDIFIYALRELNGFDEEAINIAIKLAKNDIVETDDELIDFINFNIEDEKFPNLTQPYDEKVIRRAVEKARKNENKIVHHLYLDSEEYPNKLLNSHVAYPKEIAYKGTLKNLNYKIIAITGSTTSTNNAKLAAKYFGKLFASNGYCIMSSYSGMCEQHAIKGCNEADGRSIFFLPQYLENLTDKQQSAISYELETGRSTLMSVAKISRANDDTIEEAYYYTMSLSDCLIVTQIKRADKIMRLVEKFLAANKPVYIINYLTGDQAEYDCISYLTMRGAKFISSSTALAQIQEAIGLGQMNDL